MSAKKKVDAAKEFKINEQKWTKTLMDAGWTVVPSIIIERQQALGLDSRDLNILLHLATYWWTPDNRPHPSVQKIADAVGVHRRTVQRRIERMEKDGLIERQERRNKGKGQGSKTNIYHFDGLIKEAMPYAQEKIEERYERAEAAKKKAKKKGKPNLKIVGGAKDAD